MFSASVLSGFISAAASIPLELLSATGDVLQFCYFYASAAFSCCATYCICCCRHIIVLADYNKIKAHIQHCDTYSIKPSWSNNQSVRYDKVLRQNSNVRVFTISIMLCFSKQYLKIVIPTHNKSITFSMHYSL